MLLDLEHHERVEICTADNRFMHVRCTKLYHGTPTLELLPRLRYQLRVHPISAREFSTTSLFFSYGLLLLPKESKDGFIRTVVAMNMGDKIVRVYTNMEMSLERAGCCSPRHSGDSSPDETPDCQKYHISDQAYPFRADSVASEERHDGNVIRTEEYSAGGCLYSPPLLASTQLSSRTERSLHPTELVQAHF